MFMVVVRRVWVPNLDVVRMGWAPNLGVVMWSISIGCHFFSGWSLMISQSVFLGAVEGFVEMLVPS